MTGGTHLLLLAAFPLLARCLDKPQVSVIPTLKQIFSGDLFYLSCRTTTSGGGVTWYFNDKEQSQWTSKTLNFTVASSTHSGSYYCQTNGQKSDVYNISVLDYIPIASLTIKTGLPVTRKGGSVVLQLNNEDGLHGWNCWVFKGTQEKKIKLKLNANDNSTVQFQIYKLIAPEVIYWCTDSTRERRSNQKRIRISAKETLLEMYPLPAMVGERLILKCIVMGTHQISRTVFYKDNAIILEGHTPTFEIPHVTESAAGQYKCNATFTHEARTEGPPYQQVSEIQDVFVQEPPFKAVLSGNRPLTCSCEICPTDRSYHWYFKPGGQQWQNFASGQSSMTPKASGDYACAAVWRDGKSSLSDPYVFYQSSMDTILIIVVLLVAIAGVVVAVLIFVWRKKRDKMVAIYEEVELKQDKEGDKYQPLRRTQGQEDNYDSLQPKSSSRQKKEEQEGYEALRKDQMTSGAYHTISVHGAAEEQEGYEALKKAEMTSGVYHTMSMHGETEKEEGYEALNKAEMTSGVYHTVGAQR